MTDANYDYIGRMANELMLHAQEQVVDRQTDDDTITKGVYDTTALGVAL